MIRLEIRKNFNITLIDKLQKHQPYHQEKLVNMSILLVKKYYHLIKDKY